MGIEPAQTQARGRMAASAERKPRVEPNDQGMRIRRGMPTWDNPQAFRNADRVELGLGLANPVLVGQLSQFKPWNSQIAIRGSPAEHGLCIAIRRKQGDDVIAPPYLPCRAAGFAENRALAIAAGIRIFHAYGERPVHHQGVAEGFGDYRIASTVQFDP